jgi:hypothetical protein
MIEDYRRLYETGKFKELSIHVINHSFPNGVVGRIVTYVGSER